MNRLIASIRRWFGKEPPEDPCVGVRAPLVKGPRDRCAGAAVKER
jgi:hypothetical protein